MDTATSPIISTASLTHMPAHLIVGPSNKTEQSIKLMLKKLYCSFNACLKCISCIQIDQKQHPALIWINPEKQYTLDHLEIVFKTISFALEPNTHFFFLLQKAETLSPACANSLLKSMEEPPQGYHFALLTERLEAVLPTIRSRCLITPISYSPQETSFFELFQAIIHTEQTTPSQFLKIVETSKINEHESLILLDKILVYFTTEYKKAIQQNNHDKAAHVDECITIIGNALTHPPMPGSSALLWKNIYLALHIIA